MKEQILSYLSPEYPWKDRFFLLSEVDSTNNRLKAMAAAGAGHGTVLVADRQTGGRGRMGRTFLSPAGVGIYLSILLVPNAPEGSDASDLRRGRRHVPRGGIAAGFVPHQVDKRFVWERAAAGILTERG